MMNVWDIILLVVLVYGLYKGYSTGFLKMLASFVSILVAYFFSSYLAQLFHGEMIERGYFTEETSYVVSFILTLILLFLSIRFLAIAIERFLQFIGLNFTNKLAGAFVGVLLYGSVCGVLLYYIARWIPFDTQDSQIYPFVKEIGTTIVEMFFV